MPTPMVSKSNGPSAKQVLRLKLLDMIKKQTVSVSSKPKNVKEEKK